MTLEEHATHLGGLVSNFQSLEFLLRAFLQKSPPALEYLTGMLNTWAPNAHQS
jgi:hypothetical protein